MNPMGFEQRKEPACNGLGRLLALSAQTTPLSRKFHQDGDTRLDIGEADHTTLARIREFENAICAV